MHFSLLYSLALHQIKKKKIKPSSLSIFPFLPPFLTMKRPNVSSPVFRGRSKRVDRDGDDQQQMVVLALEAPVSFNGHDQNVRLLGSSSQRSTSIGGGRRGGRGGRPASTPAPKERTMITRSMSMNADVLAVIESLKGKGDGETKSDCIVVRGGEEKKDDQEVDSVSVVVLDSLKTDDCSEVIMSDSVVAFEKNQDVSVDDVVVLEDDESIFDDLEVLVGDENISDEEVVVDAFGVKEEKSAEVKPSEGATSKVVGKGLRSLEEWPFALTYQEEWMWNDTNFTGPWWETMSNIPGNGSVVNEEEDDPWGFDDIWGLKKIKEIPKEYQQPPKPKPKPKP